MSTTPAVKRQPRGLPIGGRFAENDRPDADIDLLDPTARPEAAAGLTDRELLDSAITLARIGAHRVGLSAEDAEDIAQETVLSVLYTQKRNNGVPIHGGLIRQASRALISRRVDSHSRHEDSKALTMWKREVERVEGQLGRHLKAVELDDIATSIRDTWHNPRHKPRVGFQYETKLVSSDAMGLAFSEVLPTVEEYEPGGSQEAHTLADQVESGDVSKDVARRRLWNVLAAESEAPEAVRGSVAESRARRYAKAVPDAVHAAELYRKGKATKEEADALFAPFGNVSDQERRAVVTSILDRPNVGHGLWRSALDFSNARYGK